MLNLHLYQIAVTVVALFMLMSGIEKFIRHERGQTILKLAVRIIVWGGMIVIALFPRATHVIADIIGLEGNINAVILIGFILVFLLIFKILSVVERLEQQISELTRKDALSDIDRKKLKK